jgi:hypothetical protein
MFLFYMVDEDDNIAMTLAFLILAAMAVAGIVGSFTAVARDGYQQVPTRRF